MNQFFNTRNVLLMLVVAMISFFIFSLWPKIHEINPQTSVVRVILTPVVHVGEPVQIRVTVSRTKACPTTVHTWWVDTQGNVVANMITLSPFSNLIGTSSQVINTSSDKLPPGHYKIMANGILDCGDSGIFIAPNPDLYVEIVP